jgi:vitamin B12 transporter
MMQPPCRPHEIDETSTVTLTEHSSPLLPPPPGHPGVRRAARGACLTALLALPAAPALASRSFAPYQLGAIVVSAPRQGPVTGTVHTVTARQIHQSGARNLDQAVQMLPGVVVRTGGDGVPRIDVRGLRPRNVKLLINGIPFNSTYDGQFDPTLIPTDYIASITLTTGPSSVLYGDGGLAGVINIVTKQGKGPLRGTLQGEAGSGKYRSGTATVSWGHGNANALATLRDQRQDGFPLSGNFAPTASQDKGLRNNSDRHRFNLYANAGLKPSAHWHLGATVTHNEGSYGIPPITVTDPADPFAQHVHYERIENQRGNSVQLAARYRPAARWDMKTWAYVNTQGEDDIRYDGPSYSSINDPTVPNTFIAHNWTRIAGGHLQGDFYPSNDGVLSVALDGRRESWTQTGVIRDVALSGGGGGGGGGGVGGGGGGGGGATTATFGLRPLDTHRHVDIYTAAVQYSFSPTPATDLTVGYGRNWQQRQGTGSAGTDSATAQLRYHVSPATTLQASAARHVQFPTLRDLYDAASGNPDLKPQTAVTYELGARQRMGRHARVGATLYLSNVRNYIEKDRATDRFVNNDQYRFKGLELSAAKRWRALRVTASYTHQITRDLSPGSEKKQLQYDPVNTLGLQAVYRLPARVSVYGSALYVGHQYYYSIHPPLQRATLPGYMLVNVRLSWHVRPHAVTLFLGARNLFDRNYFTSYGYPQPGRVIYGGVKLALG